MSWRLYENVLRIFKKTCRNMIDFEKKKMLLITKKLKLHQDGTECCICKKKIHKKFAKDTNQKVRDHFHYSGKYRYTAHSICNLRFNVPNEVPVIFHCGSNRYYHFIIKE